MLCVSYHVKGAGAEMPRFFIFRRKNLVVSGKVCIFASLKSKCDTKSLPRGGYFCVKTEGKKNTAATASRGGNALGVQHFEL